MISNFDRERALSYLHTKYLRDEIRHKQDLT